MSYLERLHKIKTFFLFYANILTLKHCKTYYLYLPDLNTLGSR